VLWKIQLENAKIWAKNVDDADLGKSLFLAPLFCWRWREGGLNTGTALFFNETIL